MKDRYLYLIEAREGFLDKNPNVKIICIEGLNKGERSSEGVKRIVKKISSR